MSQAATRRGESNFNAVAAIIQEAIGDKKRRGEGRIIPEPFRRSCAGQVEYFGHGGHQALFIGDGYSGEVTLDVSELGQLLNANLSSKAAIVLDACKTAVGVTQFIAARLAVQLDGNTLGYEQDVDFSSNPDKPAGAEFPPSRGLPIHGPCAWGKERNGKLWPSQHQQALNLAPSL